MLLITLLCRTSSASKSKSCFILIDHYIRYTWGPPSPSHQIFINGFVFAAGQNCVYALKQAHRFKAYAAKAYAPNVSGYFWVDALCIDQNTTREKSHQVRMMAQIYERAVHVLACVGPRTDNSSLLFQLMDWNSKLLTKIYLSLLGTDISYYSDWKMPEPISESTWKGLRPLFPIHSNERESIARTFIAFMKRPYFSRVWVMQELHLASRLSLCCGMAVRSFEHLLAVSVLIDYWIDTSRCEQRLCDSTPAIAHVTPAIAHVCHLQSWYSREWKDSPTLQESFHDIEPQRGCLTLACGCAGRRRLGSVLEAMLRFQCTDVRDKLFGVLALIEWGSSRPLVPDYGKDNCEIAIEVLRLYLNHPESAPTWHVATEWPRQLREVFNVMTAGETMRASITTRFDSTIMPLHITSAYDNIGIGHHHMPDLQREGPWLKRTNFPSPPRDEWYGTPLQDTVRIGDKGAHHRTFRQYFCSDENPQRHFTDQTWPLKKIMDWKRRICAYAPMDTRPGDWILTSRVASVRGWQPLMVVVRIVDVTRGKYEIIGQVSAIRIDEGGTSTYRYWVPNTPHWGGEHSNHFDPCWNAEDLFLFDWMYISRSLSLQSTETTRDWLRIPVCSNELLSHFCGPKELGLELINRREYQAFGTPPI